jgi:nucleoside-diphosphate-sugar epimerase
MKNLEIVWITNRIVVTGGLGFIGSHFVDTMIKKGHDVGIIDNDNLEGAEF